MNQIAKITADAEAVPVSHKSVYAALVVAQANMTKALKDTPNPHFKSKYADLANVQDACLPALNAQGIAVIQPTGEDESGRFVETIFYHAESDTQIKCRVPLIVGKNDMQGYGSAVTYARRYGLMSLAGIAPEDDDGNAAAASAERAVSNAEQPAAKASPETIKRLLDLIAVEGRDIAKLCAFYKVSALVDMTANQAADAIKRMGG